MTVWSCPSVGLSVFGGGETVSFFFFVLCRSLLFVGNLRAVGTVKFSSSVSYGSVSVSSD